MIIRFAGFQGENRAIEPKLLPDTVGTVSTNQKPGRGDLRPWNAPLNKAIVPAGRKTIWRMGRDVASDANYWLSWPTVVHAVVGGNAADTSECTYYTGSGTPKWTDNTKALPVGSDSNAGARELGIPAPNSTLVLTSSDPVVADLGKYLYTFSAAEITAMTAGDVYRFTVGTDTPILVTLSNDASGDVTATSLQNQMAAVIQLTCGVTVDNSVTLTSVSTGVDFTIERKTGATTSEDYTNVTYTSVCNLPGAASTEAVWTFSETLIPLSTAFNVGKKWAVKINNSPAVSITLAAGAGTFPASVTRETIMASLSTVAGITVTQALAANGVDYDITVKTVAQGVDAHIKIDVIVPATATQDVFTTVGYPAEVKDTALAEDRYYTETFVSGIGEESAPNPSPKKITCRTTSTVTISSLAAAPDGIGITLRRIYRTQAGAAGTADFYFLREIASTAPSTTDDNRDLGEALPTTTWLMPDAGMTWLTGLWNGMMAGIVGRAVRFCEPWTYYAWPIAYEVLPTNAKPVALATFGQTLVMLTDGNPSVITGGSPESMDEQPVAFYQSCVAPLSAVGVGHGVVWASPDGLAYLGSGGSRLLTNGIMTRDDWQAIIPSTIQGAFYNGLYFGVYNDGARKGFIIDPASPQGMFFLDFGADALHVDALQDALFILDGVNVKKWDAGAALTTTFKSKVFHQPRPVPAFGCAEVIGSYPCTFKLYADGVLKHTQTVANASPFRLPSGYHGQDFQMEVSTTGDIQLVAMAHTMQELAQT